MTSATPRQPGRATIRDRDPPPRLGDARIMRPLARGQLSYKFKFKFRVQLHLNFKFSKLNFRRVATARHPMMMIHPGPPEPCNVRPVQLEVTANFKFKFKLNLE